MALPHTCQEGKVDEGEALLIRTRHEKVTKKINDTDSPGAKYGDVAGAWWVVKEMFHHECVDDGDAKVVKRGNGGDRKCFVSFFLCVCLFFFLKGKVGKYLCIGINRREG